MAQSHVEVSRNNGSPEIFVAELARGKVALFAQETLREVNSRNAIDPLTLLFNSENKKFRKAAEMSTKIISKEDFVDQYSYFPPLNRFLMSSHRLISRLEVDNDR